MTGAKYAPVFFSTTYVIMKSYEEKLINNMVNASDFERIFKAKLFRIERKRTERIIERVVFDEQE